MMKRVTSVGIVLMMIVSGLILLNGSNDKAEGKLLNDTILTTRSRIAIDGNSNFTSGNGVSLGSGTLLDPYIIENFKIDASNGHGIEISNTDKHFMIRNCWIFDGWDHADKWHHGIHLENVQNGEVVNCLFVENGGGVMGFSSSNILVHNNTCTGNSDGIGFYTESSGIIITNNTCEYGGMGIQLRSNTQECLVSNNYCYRNRVVGIDVMQQSVNITIEYNQVKDTWDSSYENDDTARGIDAERSKDIIIRFNNVTGTSGWGIWIHESDGCQVYNNTINSSRGFGDLLPRYGIGFSYSTNSYVKYNQLWECGFHYRETTNFGTNFVDQTNKVNGDPVLLKIGDTSSEAINGNYGQVLLTQCRNKVISGLDLEKVPHGVMIWDSSDIEIKNCHISDSYQSIYISDSSHINVHDCTFITVSNGVRVFDSSYITIDNNTISDSYRGIYLHETYLSHIGYNEVFSEVACIRNFGKGNGHTNRIHHNVLSGAMVGLDLWDDGHIVSYNVIISNRNMGIEALQGYARFEGNQIIGNGIGLRFLQLTDNNVVTRNMFMKNGKGLVTDDSSYNVITYNNFSQNTGYGFDQDSTNGRGHEVYYNIFYKNNGGRVQARNIGGTSTWNDPTLGGNYWSDYAQRYVPPATHDGTFWNTPYAVDGAGDADPKPLVNVPFSLESILRLTGITKGNAHVGHYYSTPYSIVYTGNRTDNISWSFSTNADWLTFDQDHVLKGTPNETDRGDYWVNISVTDGVLSDFINFTVRVDVKNFRPNITTADVTNVDQWKLYKVDYNATDDGDNLVWTVVTNATFLSIDEKTGVLSGTPGLYDVGMFLVNVSVSDGELLDVNYFYLTVNDVNDPPMQNSSKTYFLMMEDTTLSYPIYDLFFNYDEDPMEISVDRTGHVNATIDEEDNLLIIPDANWHGTHKMNFSVSDGYYNKTFSLDVIVQKVNDIPSQLTITFNSTEMVENGNQTVVAEFFDPDINDSANITWFVDGNAVSYDLSYNLSLPVGLYNLTLRVTDSSGNYTEITIVITVEGIGTDSTTPTGPDYTWMIILVVSFLTLTLVGALLFILRRKSSPKEEEISIPSTPISKRRPGSLDLDLEPSLEFTPSGVKEGHLGEEVMEDTDDIPWLKGLDQDIDELMEKALESEHIGVHNTSSMMRRLKSRKRNGELTKDEYEELRSQLLRIKEE